MSPEHQGPVPEGSNGPDRGSALILVLVLILVVSLLSLPMMNYFVSITRANTVLSEKTRRMEAVRGAFRVALSDPVSLYETCGQAGETVAITLASAEVPGIPVTTRCFFVDFASAENDDELRFGLVATQVGATIPAALTGSRHEPAAPSDPASWLNDVTLSSTTDKVWLPNLPVRAKTPRSSVPFRLPVGYPDCDVYFPGTYADPLVLAGPTYFASGIYYFESEVLVVDGADVVVGQGHPGCTNDQEVVFYVENPPTVHHITGHGATWVLGEEARLVVRGEGTAPLSLRFSPRYVPPEDTGGQPSQGVSIVTVNGEIVDGAGAALDLPGLLHVPLSQVGSVETADAWSQNYRPNLHTPRPSAPGAPRDVVVHPLAAHLRVVWTEPDHDGGSAIEEYVVEATRLSNPTEVVTCSTPNSRRDCTLGGLVNGQAYQVLVRARNAIGMSEPSVIAAGVPSEAAGAVVVPSSPTNITVDQYDGAVVVAWTAAADGGAAITSYAVTGVPAGSCVADTGETSCVIAGIPPLAAPEEYTFTVSATNIAGASAPSAPSLGAQPVGPPLVPPEPTEPPPPGRVPPAVVDIDVVSGAQATVEIPGYVSVPQGRVRVDNPNAHRVDMRGGVLAATFDITDGRAGDPPAAGQVPIGFTETVVQRKFRIVSETTSGLPRLVSTAIVQVNENGAYAINAWEVR